MPETTTSRDGTTIAFDRTGDGPSVLLIGGALSDRTAVGERVDTPPYAVEREVEDAGSLIDAVGGSSFVFGHSSGAVLALELARSRPGAVTKLAVYEPPFIVDDSRPPLPDDYVEHLEELVGAGRRGDAVAYFLRNGS